MKDEDSILVGCFGDVAWVRLNGNASHLNSHLVRDFADDYVSRGGRQIVVDLENCPGMDSTFIGILTGLTMRMAEMNGKIEVVNANDRNFKSVKKLGLDELITIDRDGTSWTEERALVADNVNRPLPKKELSKRERAEMMLKAHETLVEANEKNYSQFRDVLEYLKKDVDAMG